MVQSEDAPPITGQNAPAGGAEPSSATRYDNTRVAWVQKVAHSEDAPPTRFCHVATNLVGTGLQCATLATLHIFPRSCIASECSLQFEFSVSICNSLIPPLLPSAVCYLNFQSLHFALLSHFF